MLVAAQLVEGQVRQGHRYPAPPARIAARTDRSMSAAPGVSASSRTGLCGTGSEAGADPQDGRRQLAEQALGHRRGYLTAHPAVPVRLGGDHQAAGAPGRLLHRVEVQGHEGAHVDDLDVDAVGREALGRAQGLAGHDPVGGHGDVGAGPPDRGLAEGHQVVRSARLAAQPGQHLVHEEDDRVGPAQRRLDQALGVRRGARHGDQQAGDMAEPGLQAVVVLRPAAGEAGRAPDDQRNRAVPPVAHLRRLVHDLVHGAEREVSEVEVHHRAQAVEGRTHPGRHHRRLGDGGVAHPVPPELRPEPGHLGPVTTALVQVGAHDQDARVPGHLLGQAIAVGPGQGGPAAGGLAADGGHDPLLMFSSVAVTPSVTVAGSGSGAASAAATASATRARARPAACS